MHGTVTESETGQAKIVDELGKDPTNLLEHRGNRIRCCIGSVNIS
jgi:hypothetical protein